MRANFLHWVDDPPGPTNALHFAGPSWDWQRYTYIELSRLTRQMSDGLIQAGAQRNHVVAIVSSPGPHFIAAVFGAMLAGCTPSVIAPPLAFRNSRGYDAHLLHVLHASKASLLLASPEAAQSLRTIAALRTRTMTTQEVLEAGTVAGPSRELADLALLQFTGGSSGRVRGVCLPYKSLQANVEAIRDWLDWSRDGSAAFWIPPYHDMGLIGGVVAPLASRCELWLMSPEQFVRRPVEYLRCFGERGARLTALPSFGLDYICRRVRREQLEGMDFSTVKGFVVGAELIDSLSLSRFQDLLSPFGLAPGSILPAYGLAEATLAVTGLPPGQTWTALSPAEGLPSLVGCGVPLGDNRVTIAGENGQALAEGRIGEIVVHGASLGAGYRCDEESESLTVFKEGSLFSGDAGFVLDGQLFPVGRLGDSIKIRGEALFAELFESELSKAGYAKQENCVILGMRDGRPHTVWVTERLGPNSPEAALRLLSGLTEGAPVSLVDLGRGGIPRTSSGKPQRRLLWNAFVNGHISGKVLPDSGS
jgi:acyl-CoA synthetase (AMP-forming)/AMP-acid ligase II